MRFLRNGQWQIEVCCCDTGRYRFLKACSECSNAVLCMFVGNAASHLDQLCESAEYSGSGARKCMFAKTSICATDMHILLTSRAYQVHLQNCQSL